MKELVKPNQFEENKSELNYYCEVDCTGGGDECEPTVANKGCNGGATNNSIDDETEILF